MTKFKIETWSTSSSDWESVLTLTPEYYVVLKQTWKKWWLGRRWIGIIPNMVEAEVVTRLKAIHYAKSLMPSLKPTQAVRVQAETVLAGAKSKAVVWESKPLGKPMSMWRKVWVKLCLLLAT